MKKTRTFSFKSREEYNRESYLITTKTRMFVRFLILCFLVLAGCEKKAETSLYKVGIDPTFFPQDFDGKEMYVLSFTSDLFEEIGKETNLQFLKNPKTWDNLIFSLKKKENSAVISSMDPVLTNEVNFSFSDVYLHTGPVLVVRTNQAIESFDQFNEAFIGVLPRTKSAFFVETMPQLLPKYYGNTGEICYALDAEEIDGALIDGVVAVGFVNDLFKGRLKIVSRPMFNIGLRLVTEKNQNSELIKEFNEGLKKVIESGRYSELLVKWKLA